MMTKSVTSGWTGDDVMGLVATLVVLVVIGGGGYFFVTTAAKASKEQRARERADAANITEVTKAKDAAEAELAAAYAHGEATYHARNNAYRAWTAAEAAARKAQRAGTEDANDLREASRAAEAAYQDLYGDYEAAKLRYLSAEDAARKANHRLNRAQKAKAEMDASR